MSKLFQPQYLKELCKKYGLTPSRKYGQNFLINPEPIEKMIEAAGVSAGDTVVEVGPGFGVLTFALASKAKMVEAFEIEKKLQPYWDDAAKNKNIKIIWGNVLKNPALPAEPYKVVANIPYQITSNLIRTLLTAKNQPESVVLMVQKEVAERICAKPGEMSVLSVSVQLFANPEIIMNVPRSYFWPEPAVDSAIIRLSLRGAKRRSNPSEVKGIATLPSGARDDKLLFKVVKAGFASRRKMLIKNLEPIVGKENKEKLRKIFIKLGLNDKARAQELSIQNWVDLVKELSFPT